MNNFMAAVTIHSDFGAKDLLLRLLKSLSVGFPGGPVVRIHLAVQGDMGLIPRLEDPMYHEQQIPRATITEARAPRACALQQEKPLQ